MNDLISIFINYIQKKKIIQHFDLFILLLLILQNIPLKEQNMKYVSFFFFILANSFTFNLNSLNISMNWYIIFIPHIIIPS